MHRQLGEFGACGVAVPKEFGGTGLDYLSLALVPEEIAVGDGGTSTVINMSNCPVCSMLMVSANDAQKQRQLVPLTRDEILGVFCLIEPYVGSDVSALRTTAVRDGDYWVLNGVRQFITSGKHADVTIIMAVTDETTGKRGVSALLVPTDTPGYIVTWFKDKLGRHSPDTVRIVFKDCHIPAGCLLSEEGAGYKMALSGLEGGRIGIVVQSVGMVRAALEAALAYAKECRNFGQSLFAHQAAQFRLAEVTARVDMAWQMVWHVASLKDVGPPCLKEAAIAKLSASEMAGRMCSDVIQAFSGYGYISNFPVEHTYRDACVYQTYESTSDTQRILIARALAQVILGEVQHNKGSTSWAGPSISISTSRRRTVTSPARAWRSSPGDTTG